MRFGKRLGLGMGAKFGQSVAIPTPTLRFNLDAANVVKDGSNLIATITNLGSIAGQWDENITGRKPLWVDNGDLSGTRPIMNQTPDGTNLKRMRWLSIPSDPFTAASGFTTFLVTKVTLSGGASGDPIATYNTGAARGGFQLEVVSNLRQCQARTSGGTSKQATFGTYTTNTWEIWCVRNWGGGADDVDSTTWFKAQVNGSSVSVAGTPWFWVPTTRQSDLGASTATSGPTRIIAELRTYAAYFTDAQCTAVNRELGSRYGISVP